MVTLGFLIQKVLKGNFQNLCKLSLDLMHLELYNPMYLMVP